MSVNELIDYLAKARSEKEVKKRLSRNELALLDFLLQTGVAKRVKNYYYITYVPDMVLYDVVVIDKEDKLVIRGTGEGLKDIDLDFNVVLRSRIAKADESELKLCKDRKIKFQLVYSPSSKNEIPHRMPFTSLFLVYPAKRLEIRVEGAYSEFFAFSTPSPYFFPIASPNSTSPPVWNNAKPMTYGVFIPSNPSKG